MSEGDPPPELDGGLPDAAGNGCNILLLGWLALIVALTIALGRCGHLPRYFSPELEQPRR